MTNFFWTSVLLIVTTALGYWLGGMIDYPIAGAVIGFIVGVIARLLPKVGGEVGDIAFDIFD